MKNRYEQELDKLAYTYNWALSAPIEKLRNFVLSAQGKPLIAVGSGGSYASAVMAAMLHEAAGSIATTTTPFQLTFKKAALHQASILLLTASGRNSDILNAFRVAANSEPRQLMAICTRPNSPLSLLSAKISPSVFVEEYKLPTVKDGFLATNSLLALTTLIIRAYGDYYGFPWKAPKHLSNTGKLSISKDYRRDPLFNRDSFVILYGGWCLPAATDLESRFIEGALGHAQIADYRNFAHGRHHWLAKRPEDSAIIAFINPDTGDIAEQTLRLIPKNIPCLRLVSKVAGPWGGLEQIVNVMHLASIFGLKHGIALSKPGIPSFGRKIYHLKVSPKITPGILPLKISSDEAIAIRRKVGIPLETMQREVLSNWHDAYIKFLKRLTSVSFNSVIFDYDGTLCEQTARFEPLLPKICQYLTRLVKSGILIGIATGRGKSAQASLRKAIPKIYWPNVLIGCYNCSDIGKLNDDNHPNKDGCVHSSLLFFESYVSSSSYCNRMFEYEIRPNQITIVPKNGYRGFLRKWLFDIFGKYLINGVQILESSHSFDILASGVSKCRLLTACQELTSQCGEFGKVLCIGDKGAWPGNDYSLLSEPFALSVDEASTDFETCWNLTPPGYKGLQATVYYLESLKFKSSGLVKLELQSYLKKK